MKISVIVPTVERVESLRNCLNCLLKQKYPVFEIIVVYYEKDLPTIEALKDFPTVRKVMVSKLGHHRANNAGKKAASGDILSFIDDDTRPGEMWSQKIADYFIKMPDLKGLGGRDRIFHPDGKSVDSPLQNEVGVFKWYGKRIGNHHLGRGEARSVDSLKGCNMSFIASFISDIYFDEKLRGLGDICCNDLDFCLQVKRKGGLIIYDPHVGLDHYVWRRPSFELNQRTGYSFVGKQNAAINYFYTVKKNKGFLIFFKCGIYSILDDFLRPGRAYFVKRVLVSLSAFFIVLFKKV